MQRLDSVNCHVKGRHLGDLSLKLKESWWGQVSVCLRCVRALHSARPTINQEKKKHINRNKFAGLSPGLGGCQKFVYVFFRVIPYGGRKTHKQNSPKIAG